MQNTKRTVCFWIRLKKSVGDQDLFPFFCTASSMLEAMQHCQDFVDRYKKIMSGFIAAIYVYAPFKKEDNEELYKTYLHLDDIDNALDISNGYTFNKIRLYSFDFAADDEIHIDTLYKYTSKKDSEVIFKFTDWDLAATYPYI